MAEAENDLESRVAGLRAVGQYRDARGLAEKSVLALEAAAPSIELVGALIALGRNAVDLGDHLAASAAFDRAIEIADERPRSADLLADALAQAVLLALFTGQPSQAVHQAERARSIANSALESTNPTLARVFANVALVRLEVDGAEAASALIDRVDAVIAGSPVGPARDIARIEVLEAAAAVDRAAGRYAGRRAWRRRTRR
jgi:tetratricopeptide (TPR) repeat protein